MKTISASGTIEHTGIDHAEFLIKRIDCGISRSYAWVGPKIAVANSEHVAPGVHVGQEIDVEAPAISEGSTIYLGGAPLNWASILGAAETCQGGPLIIVDAFSVAEGTVCREESRYY